MDIKLDIDDVKETIPSLYLSQEEQEEIISLAVNTQGLNWDETNTSILNVIKTSYSEYDLNNLRDELNSLQHLRVVRGTKPRQRTGYDFKEE